MDIAAAQSLTANDLTGASTTQLSSKELGKEDFLQLLVVQLQHQDPLEPMDNKDLILQLAQFSTIEGTENLNNNFEAFLGTSYINTASSMIGKQVSYLDRETMTEMSGVVDQINVTDDDVVLSINGSNVSMADIFSVSNPEEATDPAEE